MAFAQLPSYPPFDTKSDGVAVRWSKMTSEWGKSTWDVDEAAESLNRDLFGTKHKKKNKTVVAPDANISVKNVDGIQDSDDEHFSKKAKKRMKEKKRKLRKKKGETVNSNDVKESSANVQLQDNDKSDKGKSKEKKNKNSNVKDLKNSPGTHPSRMNDKSLTQNGQGQSKMNVPKPPQSDEKEMPDLPKTDSKKRKRLKLENVDCENVKKRKVMENESNGKNGKEQEEKKKRRRNRKKKNNSKKNKYKHLALNAKKETDVDNKKSDKNVMKIASEEKKINSVPQKQDSDTISGQIEAESLLAIDTSPERKAKNKKRKSETMLYPADTSISDKAIGTVTVNTKAKKRKEGENVKSTKLNKNKLIDMLNTSSINVVGQSSLPKGNSGVHSNLSKKKEKRKKRNSEDKSMENEEKMEEKLTPKSIPACSAAEKLKNKATEKLNAARFRFINEQMYTCEGREAQQFFQKDKEAFKIYHQGFQSQTAKWPVNPLDVFIRQIKKRPKQLVIADFGCGDAKLSQSVEQKVNSFDLVALNDRVTACDMSKIPLPDDSVDIAVFCLSLMGTNLNDYVLEANRVLKPGGLLKVAEVTSRFQSPEKFIKQVSSFGFNLLNRRELHDMFYLMDFNKGKRIKKSPPNTKLKLKPCVYKRR